MCKRLTLSAALRGTLPDNVGAPLPREFVSRNLPALLPHLVGSGLALVLGPVLGLAYSDVIRECRHERLKAFRGRPLHDWTSHGADAFRYLAMGLPEAAPRQKPITYPKGSYV